MRHTLGALALAAALGLAAGGAYAQDDGLFWGDDNWAEDEYGYYDEDFAYETSEAFNEWYGEAGEGWEAAYDDVGDEGFFDV